MFFTTSHVCSKVRQSLAALRPGSLILITDGVGHALTSEFSTCEGAGPYGHSTFPEKSDDDSSLVNIPTKIVTADKVETSFDGHPVKKSNVLSLQVNPETYVVTADGVELTCEPAKSLPLTQRYFLF